MDRPAANSDGTPRASRHYETVRNGSEPGYYETSSDVHLYDWMGTPLGELDEPEPRDPGDILAATAAWAVAEEYFDAIKNWLHQRRREPLAWLTPWRKGEPSITADIWLDQELNYPPAGPANIVVTPPPSGFLVVRLDNSYLPYTGLRASLDRAVDRFQDSRRAIESEIQEETGISLPRATTAWMKSMDATDDDDELELESNNPEAEGSRSPTVRANSGPGSNGAAPTNPSAVRPNIPIEGGDGN